MFYLVDSLPITNLMLTYVVHMLHVLNLNFDKMMFYQTYNLLIEKVHLDDLDLYVITFAVLATSVLL